MASYRKTTVVFIKVPQTTPKYYLQKNAISTDFKLVVETSLNKKKEIKSGYVERSFFSEYPKYLRFGGQ